MGFFDSKSKSEQLSQNAGFSEIAGAVTSLNIKGGGKKSTQVVNVLDGGAVASSLKFAGDTVERSLRAVEMSSGGAVAALTEAARSETENVLLQGGKWLVVAVIAVAGFYALGKLKG